MQAFDRAVAVYRRAPTGENLHDCHHAAWALLMRTATLLMTADAVRCARADLVIREAGNPRCPN